MSGVINAHTTKSGVVPNNFPGYTFRSVQSFSSTGTWTKPAGVTAVYVIVTGPGGAGGGMGVTNDAGAGGSAGGTAIDWITSGLGATETVTIGTGGGTGGGGATTNGSDGSGASSFGSHCSASQGLGGRHGNNNPGGRLGGVGTGGSVANIRGGTSPGGQDAANHVPSTAGGQSYWAGGGIGGSYYETAVAGTMGSGGGGGFDQSPSAGEAAREGGAGFCVVYEYTG